MQATRGTPLTSRRVQAGSRRAISWWALLTGVVYLLDQSTKWWAERALSDGEPRLLLGSVLKLHLTHNAGAAFSAGTGYTVVLTVIALAVVITCLALATRLQSLGWATALGLLLGGALGNVTDRLVRSPAPFRGHVVDFLELPNWPVFNVADAAICTAAATFVLLSARGARIDDRPAPAEAVTGGREGDPSTMT